MSEFLVNGANVTCAAPPRTHLADFLRETMLLTATHLGCEQGVCGACTILIDGAPARACLTPAVLCAGRRVETLEGLDDDATLNALRAAFSAEHALQCGYCTPGMLITARDIVLRLPAADEPQIRLELAGNLCRCTGYAGIVRAIGRVLAARQADAALASAPADPAPPPALASAAVDTAPSPALASAAVDAAPPPALASAAVDTAPPPALASAAVDTAPPPALASAAVDAAPPPALASAAVDAAPPSAPIEAMRPAGGGRDILATARIGLPAAQVWAALADPAVIARCIPGASLDRIDGDRISGAVLVALGPIRARFAGSATLSLDHAGHSGRIEGESRDEASASRLAGQATFAVAADGAAATIVSLRATYRLRGALAQFGRGPVVEAFARQIVRQTAEALEAQLRGAPAPTRQRAIGPGLVLSALWQFVRGLFSLRRE